MLKKYSSMKNNYFISEILISLTLLLILIFCLNPFGILMPPPLVSMLVISLLLFVGIFASFIWKERSGDERENYHKLLAGHLAFLTGVGLLGIAIAFQELNHTLDPWLVYILIAMLLAKIIGRIYSQKKF